ncbi:hypothetical protein EGR_08049 [Echinococcus granulosus]|uniref:Uncharacterized protein n=1 Tax=Echinococcus granulosus TaxID=6210 RepID=W6U9B8_ECHGR|nr:hypothetical protein EGR_08049 [Echinococcus granulosus]EUB57101.1 hypothetical protein EGR_08049 [Echinococcus granulosus]
MTKPNFPTPFMAEVRVYAFSHLTNDEIMCLLPNCDCYCQNENELVDPNGKTIRLKEIVLLWATIVYLLGSSKIACRIFVPSNSSTLPQSIYSVLPPISRISLLLNALVLTIAVSTYKAYLLLVILITELSFKIFGYSNLKNNLLKDQRYDDKFTKQGNHLMFHSPGRGRINIILYILLYNKKVQVFGFKLSNRNYFLPFLEIRPPAKPDLPNHLGFNVNLNKWMSFFDSFFAIKGNGTWDV